MRIAIVGGKLQGVEAAYLAHKAGYSTLLIDKNPNAPASGLCDDFLRFNFSRLNPIPKDAGRIDLILPAIENVSVLSCLQHWAKADSIPLAFDMQSYFISSSKIRSDSVFEKLNLARPKKWPDCSLPVVVKPDQASGSKGVEVVCDQQDLADRLADSFFRENHIVEQYLDGFSYSVEVIGRPGDYKVLQVTDLGMDENFDCCRVTAPTQLHDDHVQKFNDLGICLAEEIGLNGLMDVEVICHENKLKLLEIDARLPSQTPTAVFWSSGYNMVENLARLCLNNSPASLAATRQCYVSVEHIRVQEGKIFHLGENVMSQDGPLAVKPDFFGADEAITSFKSGKSHWVATMIFSGECQRKIKSKRKKCYNRIAVAVA